MSIVEHFVNDVNIHRAIMEQVHIQIRAMEAVLVPQVVPMLDIHIPMDQVQCMAPIMARVECMVVVMVRVECTIIPIINITHTDKWDIVTMVIIDLFSYSL